MLGTISESTRQLALSENMDLKALASKGRAIESSSNFSNSIRIKEEPLFEAESVNLVSQRGGGRNDRGDNHRPDVAQGKCFNCGGDYPCIKPEECGSVRLKDMSVRTVEMRFKEFCKEPTSSPSYQPPQYNNQRYEGRGPRRGQYGSIGGY